MIGAALCNVAAAEYSSGNGPLSCQFCRRLPVMHQLCRMSVQACTATT